MRRLTAAAALGAILAMCAAALTASPAFAGRGHQWHLVPVRPFTFDTRYCGFRVHATFPFHQEYAKILKATDGSMTTLTTGALTATFTNLRTGKAITENVSGPGKITANSHGSAPFADKGHTPFFLVPADAARFGLPTVSVTAGALTGSVAADGSLTSLTLRGHVLVDVCAALS